MQAPLPSCIREIMALCARRGIALAVRNNQLVATPAGKLDDALRATLRKRRDALILHLSRPLIAENPSKRA